MLTLTEMRSRISFLEKEVETKLNGERVEALEELFLLKEKEQESLAKQKEGEDKAFWSRQRAMDGVAEMKGEAPQYDTQERFYHKQNNLPKISSRHLQQRRGGFKRPRIQKPISQRSTGTYYAPAQQCQCINNQWVCPPGVNPPTCRWNMNDPIADCWKHLFGGRFQKIDGKLYLVATKGKLMDGKYLIADSWRIPSTGQSDQTVKVVLNPGDPAQEGQIYLGDHSKGKGQWVIHTHSANWSQREVMALTS